jgi:hypothetical protein
MQLPNIDELGDDDSGYSGLDKLGKGGRLLTKKLTSGRVVVMMVCLRDEN